MHQSVCEQDVVEIATDREATRSKIHDHAEVVLPRSRGVLPCSIKRKSNRPIEIGLTVTPISRKKAREYLGGHPAVHLGPRMHGGKTYRLPVREARRTKISLGRISEMVAIHLEASTEPLTSSTLWILARFSAHA